jgi:hypothetical protein
MRKRITALSMAFALASLIGMAVPAASADLHEPHTNTPCVGTTCQWHFVNNQLNGAGEGDLWVYFDPAGPDGPDWVGPIDPDKVLKKVQHWWVTTGKGTLLDARTVANGSGLNGSQQPGKLVLSDLKYCCGCGCTPS